MEPGSADKTADAPAPSEGSAKSRAPSSTALAIVAGAAVALSVVPWPAPPFIFVFPALFLAALTPRQGEVVGVGRAIGVGLVAGVVASFGVMYWMPGVFVSYAAFPTWAAWLLGFAIFAWHSGPFVFAAVATAIVVRVAAARTANGGRASAAPAWLVLPAAIAVGFAVMPTLFPWRPTIGAIALLPYVQLVEVTGQPLVDALIGLVGTGALTALRRRRAGDVLGAKRAAITAAAALLVPLAYGLVRIPMVEASRDAAEVVRIGVVQPNVGVDMKHDAARVDEILRRLHRLTDEVEASRPDLVLWPETSYPAPFPRAVRTDLPGRASVAGRSVDVPLVFGAVTAVGSGCQRWNSALALENGRIVGVVDKVRLVPFTEFVPFWNALPAVRAVVRCPGFVRGRGAPVLEIAGRRLGVFNCFEDILASRSFRVAREDPDVLVNLTNDAWFGDTLEPQLHHLAARLRAIETRRDLVRAVNTGVSGHVSATGEDLGHTDTYVEATFVADARVLEGRTPFARLGDVTTPVLAGYLLLPLVLRVRDALRRRRRRADQPS